MRFLPVILALGLSACQRSENEVSRPGSDHQSRYAMGTAAFWQARVYSISEEENFQKNFLLRRKAGWDAAQRALRPVPLHQPAHREVPAFLTWYGKDDLDRMFKKLYGDLSPVRRETRSGFSAGELQAAEIWNSVYTASLSVWQGSRLEEWLESLDSPLRVHGLGGLTRTYYNRAAAMHILKNYEGVIGCRNLAEGTEATHPGLSESNFTLCLASEFPRDAAIIKTSWRRTDFGLGVPVWRTDAATLENRLRNHQDWGPEEGLHRPDSREIFTMESPQGDRFVLTGLHLMTRELREWFWVTLWWAPDADSDFGNDRPRNSTGSFPFSSYKMCVVTSYEERETGENLQTQNSLKETWEAVHRIIPDDTWCSNPYLEKGTWNHRSNCIGCHQQGGTGTVISEILSQQGLFPGNGRKKIRNNFPTDYLWSLTREPENISAVFRRTVSWFPKKKNPAL